MSWQFVRCPLLQEQNALCSMAHAILLNSGSLILTDYCLPKRITITYYGLKGQT